MARHDSTTGQYRAQKSAVKWNANQALLGEQFVIIYFFCRTASRVLNFDTTTAAPYQCLLLSAKVSKESLFRDEDPKGEIDTQKNGRMEELISQHYILIFMSERVANNCKNQWFLTLQLISFQVIGLRHFHQPDTRQNAKWWVQFIAIKKDSTKDISPCLSHNFGN